jgi:hypothetical protein
MSETKEMLEATVKGLEGKISQLNMDLKSKQQELEDANKPVISSATMGIINDTVNQVIENYDFECGHFDYEFNISYDNRIELGDLSYSDSYELVEAIVTKIERQFKVEKENA